MAILLLEDAAAILIGFTGMNDQRQTGCTRGSDMRAKPSFLRFAGAVLVEVIQPRLPERHDLRMAGQFDQFVGGNSVFFIRVVRMRTDRAIDVRKSPGDLQKRAEASHPRGDRDDTPDPGRRGPRHDRFEIGGKVGKIEMAVAVDQHRLGPLKPLLRCNGEIPRQVREALCRA